MTGAVTTSGVLPRYIYRYSETLSTNIRQRAAFQATCRCGWTGKWRSERLRAVEDDVTHRQKKHGGIRQ